MVTTYRKIPRHLHKRNYNQARVEGFSKLTEHQAALAELDGKAYYDLTPAELEIYNEAVRENVATLVYKRNVPTIKVKK